MRIDDSSSIDDHIRKAIGADFFLSHATTLHPEVARSIRILARSNPVALRARWELQLEGAKGVVNTASGIQEIRHNATPGTIRSATCRLRTATLAFVLKTIDLGRERWVGKFTYGFPISRDLSQEVAHPRDTSCTTAQPIRDIWEGVRGRFNSMARASCYLRAQTLLGER